MTSRLTPVLILCVFVSFSESARAQVSDKSQVPSSERFALVVGVGHYKDPLLHSLYADNDASTFAKDLQDYAAFPKDNVAVLATSEQREDEQPTRQNILEALRRLSFKASQENGLLIFYFSGHGQSVGNETVLFPSDLKYNSDTVYLQDAGVKVSTISAFLAESGVKRVLIFVDACRDSLFAAKGNEGNPLSKAFMDSFSLEKQNKNIEVFSVIFSSEEGGVSYQYQDRKMGYFTWALNRAFEQDGYDQDNRLTLGGLAQYLHSRVADQVKKDIGKKQVPFPHIVPFSGGDLLLAGMKAPPYPNPELLSGTRILISPDGKEVFVANEQYGVINVFEGGSTHQQRIIDLRPAKPHVLAMAAKRHELYFTDTSTGSVAAVDSATGQIKYKLRTGDNPNSLAVMPDESKLYVSNEQPAPQGSITVIDLGQRSVIGTISGVNCPEGLAMAPDGTFLYVASQCGFGKDPVFIVNTKTDRVVSSISGFAVGSRLAITRSGTKVYVPHGQFWDADPVTGSPIFHPNLVSVIRRSDNQVRAIQPPAGMSELSIGYFAFTPDDRYALGVGGSKLFVIDVRIDQVVGIRDLGSSIDGIAVGLAPDKKSQVCYVWLPEARQLFFTGLSGLLPANNSN